MAKEEKLTSAEIGVKSEMFDRKLRLNVDGYMYQVHDQQLVAVGGQTNTARLLNADRTDGYGLEADVDIAPSADWLITLGASYNRTEIKDPSLLVGVCFACTVIDPIVGGNARIDGNPLPNAPEWIFNGIVDYRHPMGSGLFSASFDWAYASEKNFFLYESKEFKADSLELGTRVGYTFPDARYEIAAVRTQPDRREDRPGRHRLRQPDRHDERAALDRPGVRPSLLTPRVRSGLRAHYEQCARIEAHFEPALFRTRHRGDRFAVAVEHRRAIEGEARAARPERGDRGMGEMPARVDARKHREKLRAGDPADDHDIEQPVGRVGAGRNVHSAPEPAGIGEGDEHDLALEAPAIVLERRQERLEAREHADHRPGVDQRAAQTAHALGVCRALAVEAGACDATEDPATGPAEIDPGHWRRESGDDRSAGLERKPQLPRQIVAGAERDRGERATAAGETPRRPIPGAVAAGHQQTLDTRLHCTPRALGQRLRTGWHLERDAVPARGRRDRGERTATATSARGGVEQNPGGHRWQLVVLDPSSDSLPG